MLHMIKMTDKCIKGATRKVLMRKVLTRKVVEVLNVANKTNCGLECSPHAGLQNLALHSVQVRLGQVKVGLGVTGFPIEGLFSLGRPLLGLFLRRRSKYYIQILYSKQSGLTVTTMKQNEPSFGNNTSKVQNSIHGPMT